MDGNSLWTLIIGFITAGIIFLPIVFAIRSRKKRFQPEPEKDIYILYLPLYYFWIGLLCSVVFFAFIVVSLVVLDLNIALYAVITFMVLSLSGTYLDIYCLLRKIVVDTDSLTIYSPFLPARKIKFYEISLMEEKNYGLLGHTKSGKRFVIDREAAGYGILYRQLYSLGKMNRMEESEDFCVTMDRHEMASITVGLLIFGGDLAALLIVRDETADIYLYVSCAGMAAAFLFYWLYELLWKVTVSFNGISVRLFPGEKKSYDIREITMVFVERNNIVLYAGNKKIIKAYSHYKNYVLLLNYLANKQIPFYTKQ